LFLAEGLKDIYDSREAAAVASFLIESVTGLGIVQQLTNRSMPLSDKQSVKILDGLAQLQSHRPVQYVAGYGWFLGKKYFVSPEVLIPRQETEELVLLAIKRAGHNFDGTIIDFCTGSGCIAASLAASLPKARIYATDISAGALETAALNCKEYELHVTLLKHDLLTESLKILPTARILVSNPPYVRSSEMALMEPRVTGHEPHNALFVSDTDPLVFYRHLLEAVELLLEPGGWFCFEINEALGKEMENLFSVPFIRNLTLTNDINAKNRFLSGTRG